MKVSIVTDEISQDLKVAIEFGLKYGITNFAIRSVWGKNVALLSQKELQKVKLITNSFNVNISCIFSPLYKCFPYEFLSATNSNRDFYDFSTRLSEHKKVFPSLLNAAKILNAPNIRIFSFLKSKFTHQEQYNKVKLIICNELSIISSKAKTSGVNLLLENEHSCYIDTLEKLHDFMLGCKNTQLKLAIDISNHLKAKLSNTEINLQVIDKLLKYTIDFHVKDIDTNGRYVTIGNGIIKWDSIFDFLMLKNYEGFVTLEPHLRGDIEGIKTSIRRVLEWIK